METSNGPWIYEDQPLECALKCKDAETLFEFPRTQNTALAWMAKIGPRSLPPSISKARVCNKHFSSEMFIDSETLKDRAIPDINLPEGEVVVIKPGAHPSTFGKSPFIVLKNEIITSRHSKCFLKCKDAKHTYRFPVDEVSREYWVEKLGLKHLPPKTATARICNNHFSARMFCTNKHLRLTNCAIPDINLPGQTIFRPEKGDTIDPMTLPPQLVRYLSNTEDDTTARTTQEDDVQIRNMFRSMTEATLGIPSTTQPEILLDSTSQPEILIDSIPQPEIPANSNIQPEILINSIENIKNVIDTAPNKEGILHVFQPAIEDRSEENSNEPHVALPDLHDPDSECVLKCKNIKRLFRFPALEESRQLWLRQIGLTHCYFNSKLCDRHFSEKMYVKSKKRLAKFAFPDKNIPDPNKPQSQALRIKGVSKKLHEYRLLVKDQLVCDVIELPQYICVLTVLKSHSEVGAVVNGVKYVEHKIAENIPKREREVQVKETDLKETSNVAIAADDFVEDMQFEVDVNYEEVDWVKMFKAHVFSAKADMYECLICGEISLGFAHNLRHLTVHSSTSSLCFQCGRKFSSQQQLKMHEKDKHRNQMRKAHRCPKMYCKKAFHSRKQLHHHVDEHMKRNEHKCNRCLRVYSSSLKLHCHRVACRNYWSFRHPRRKHDSHKTRIK